MSAVESKAPVVVQVMKIAPPHPPSTRNQYKTQAPAWKRSLATRLKELKEQVEWLEDVPA